MFLDSALTIILSTAFELKFKRWYGNDHADF